MAEGSWVRLHCRCSARLVTGLSDNYLYIILENVGFVKTLQRIFFGNHAENCSDNLKKIYRLFKKKKTSPGIALISCRKLVLFFNHVILRFRDFPVFYRTTLTHSETKVTAADAALASPLFTQEPSIAAPIRTNMETNTRFFLLIRQHSFHEICLSDSEHFRLLPLI